MALELNYELEDSGLSANYWRLVQYRVTIDDPNVQVSLALYKDKSARDAGKRFIHMYNILVPFTDEVVTRKSLYSKIKSGNYIVESGMEDDPMNEYFYQAKDI